MSDGVVVQGVFDEDELTECQAPNTTTFAGLGWTCVGREPWFDARKGYHPGWSDYRVWLV